MNIFITYLDHLLFYVYYNKGYYGSVHVLQQPRYIKNTVLQNSSQENL